MRSWMRLYLVVFVALGLLPGRAEAAEKARVAVLELKGSLKRAELGVLSDQIRAGVVQGTQGKDLVVMSRENMAILLKDMGRDCVDVEGECEVETGRNLQAAYVVSGNVVQMGGEWLCTVKVHDVGSGAFMRSAIVRGKGVMDLVEGLPGTVASLMHQALGGGGGGGGGGGQPPVPPPPKGKPEPPPPKKLDLTEKFRQQECDADAKDKGKTERAARLNKAIQDRMKKARSDWQVNASELERCLKLKRAQRGECIQAAEDWLKDSRSMTVKLPAGEVSVTTTCGERRPVFLEESRTLSADDVGTAQTLLARLKAADVAPPPPPDSMIVGRLGPRPVPLSNASSCERQKMKERWEGCRSGKAADCTNLGFYQYVSGQGVTKSLTRAAELYRLGCDKGSMHGCKNLGNMYRDGEGVPQSHKNAVVLFRKACDGGHTGGCSNLGVQYEQGHGVPKSQSRANELYKKGCDGKNKHGCRNLGLAYEFGKAVPMNKTTARSYYKKACDLGDQDACDEPLLK